jgi:transcription termination factor Rho
MKKNEQNRNFTISSKVSSSQKAMYMQEAERLNLSLSEWMCGTLDMSINAYEEVNKMTEVKQLQEENAEKDKKIKSLTSRLNSNKLFLEIKKEKDLHHSKKIMELEAIIQNLQKRLGNYRNFYKNGK